MTKDESSNWTPMLDDEGRRMVGASHHYTPENIRALVERLRDFEDPRRSTQADWDRLDWRTFCGTLARVMAGLADGVEPSTQHPDTKRLDWLTEHYTGFTGDTIHGPLRQAIDDSMKAEER